MPELTILVVCTHPEILETIIRLLGSHPGWNAAGAGGAEEALVMMSTAEFDIVLVGSGLSEESETRLAEACRGKKPAIKMVYHFGGGSGLLASEILGALGG